ncbi:hypothetical protein, partial [Bacillus cereus]|uniref:hypothetical protein n=1 Tax=Bacillus cereus TaxID=1396 RepID=UPI00211165A2|nr:hypothetical protein [Bacillus cereus]
LVAVTKTVEGILGTDKPLFYANFFRTKFLLNSVLLFCTKQIVADDFGAKRKRRMQGLIVFLFY